MELTMNPSAKFWDRMADRYSKSPISDEASYQKKLETSRAYLQPDMDVLEFGCGTGGTAILHAPYVKHIRATDFSARMIDIAKNKLAASKVDNVSFEVGTIENSSVSEGSMDAILGLSILHLLEDEKAAISRVYRLLKPGGLFISSTPCLGDHLKFFRYIGPIGRALGLLPILNVFTSDHLLSAIKEAGFQIEHRWQPGKNKAVFVVARK